MDVDPDQQAPPRPRRVMLTFDDDVSSPLQTHTPPAPPSLSISSAPSQYRQLTPRQAIPSHGSDSSSFPFPPLPSSHSTAHFTAPSFPAHPVAKAPTLQVPSPAAIHSTPLSAPQQRLRVGLRLREPSEQDGASPKRLSVRPRGSSLTPDHTPRQLGSPIVPRAISAGSLHSESGSAANSPSAQLLANLSSASISPQSQPFSVFSQPVPSPLPFGAPFPGLFVFSAPTPSPASSTPSVFHFGIESASSTPRESPNTSALSLSSADISVDHAPHHTRSLSNSSTPSFSSAPQSPSASPFFSPDHSMTPPPPMRLTVSSPSERKLATPDPSAFEAVLTTKRLTPKSTLPRCPSPPKSTKTTSLSRKSSIWDTKSLYSASNETDECFLDKFELLEQVGEGCFFSVFRARRKTDQQIFAIKKSRHLFRSKADRARYMNEVKFQKEHPNILQYHRAWQEEGHFYIQLEFCQCNLADYVAQRWDGKAPTEFLWKCAIEIAQGLQSVHQNNVLHLDIKPANIMVGNDGTLKIGDFGQAIFRGNVADGAEGDSQYMAPELLHPTVSPDQGADMFSLGVLLFELATDLRLPTEGQFWHDLREGRVRQYVHGHTTADMENLICCLMDPSPERRISADELLRRYRPTLGVHCSQFRHPPSSSKTSRRGSMVNLQSAFLETCVEDDS